MSTYLTRDVFGFNNCFLSNLWKCQDFCWEVSVAWRGVGKWLGRWWGGRSLWPWPWNLQRTLNFHKIYFCRTLESSLLQAKPKSHDLGKKTTSALVLELGPWKCSSACNPHHLYKEQVVQLHCPSPLNLSCLYMIKWEIQHKKVLNINQITINCKKQMN